MDRGETRVSVLDKKETTPTMTIRASLASAVPDFAEEVMLRSSDAGAETATSVELVSALTAGTPLWWDQLDGKFLLSLDVIACRTAGGNTYGIELFASDNPGGNDAPGLARFNVTNVGHYSLVVSANVLFPAGGKFLWLRTICEGDSNPLLNYSLSATKSVR